MSFDSLVNSLSADTLSSLSLFRPELALVATIVVTLLLKIFPATARIDSFYVALVGSVAACWLSIQSLNQPAAEAFTGLLVFDPFGAYVRLVLTGFAVLFCIFTRISGIPDRDAATDFYPLALGATLGMCLMTASNHLFTVFLSVEMASVPSYVLAGAMKGRRKASEAALKYAIFGAGAAGVMLYGISLLAGVVSSVHLPTMAVLLAELFQAGPSSEQLMVLALGSLMVSVGLAFKLSAVPFHFWCPDVFEGATAEIAAFLSIASKAAALALLVRVTLGLGLLPASEVPVENARFSTPVVLVSLAADQSVSPQQAAAQLNDALSSVRSFVAQLIAFIAIITCTFGNLAAYGQTNIKRLLAYSTIAHAGYMLMPVAAALVLAGQNTAAANDAIAALAFYIGVYLFTNLAAFGFVAFVRNSLRTETIDDYAGLIRSMPIMVVCFAIILVSLIGIPPLAGFFGKFWIFAALVDARLWTLLVIGGLNTAISLYYYLRVIKIMTIDEEPESRVPVSVGFVPGTFVVLCTLPVIFFGLWPDSLDHFARAAVVYLLN